MSTLFGRTAYIAAENDSRDSTRTVLDRWCQSRPDARVLSLNGISNVFPVRGLRLQTARTWLLSAVRADYADFDVLIVIDHDDVNCELLDLAAFARAIAFLQSNPRHVAVFANQRGIYYDMWTLRHAKLCPGDVWENVADLAMGGSVSDEEAFNRAFAQRQFTLAPNAEPLEVESAFGGLGIYRISSLLANGIAYVGGKIKRIQGPHGDVDVGWQVCEHVAVNTGLHAAGGKLFVMPDLVNFNTENQRFIPQFWRHLSFDSSLLGRTFVPPEDSIGGRKVGRNHPCPCGSGQKFKHCHGRIT